MKSKYFIVYEVTSLYADNTPCKYNEFINEHPFDWLSKRKKEDGEGQFHIVLLFYSKVVGKKLKGYEKG